MIGNSEGNEFQAMGPLYAKQFCPCFVLRRGGLYLIHNCKMIFLLQMYSHEEGSKKLGPDYSQLYRLCLQILDGPFYLH